MSRKRNKVVLVMSHHHHDRVYGENLREFMRRKGYRLEFLLFDAPAYPQKIIQYLQDPDTAAFISLAYYGFLPRDHGLTFEKLAKNTSIPVIAWLMDHPTFYLEHVPYQDTSYAVMMICQDHVDYWHSYVNPQSDLLWCMNVGAHRRTQIPDFSADRFNNRPIFAFAPINFKRADCWDTFFGDLNKLSKSIQNFVHDVGYDGITRLDISMLDLCLNRMLQQGLAIETPMLHCLVSLVDQYVNLNRRRRLFQEMLPHPVLIDGSFQPETTNSDHRAVCMDRQDVGATLTDITRSKIVISVSNTFDYVHDRTLNAMAAGAVPLVEKNHAHLQWFEDGVDCFMFDYESQSIGQVLTRLGKDPTVLAPVAARAYQKFRESELQYYRFDTLIDYIEARLEKDLQTSLQKDAAPLRPPKRDAMAVSGSV